MALTNQPTFVKTPNHGATQISTGTGSSGVVTLYSGGANGSKITAIIGTAVGTTNPYDVQWGVSSGGPLYIYGTVSVPTNAGSTDGVATVNLLNNSALPGITFDSDGNPFIFLASSSWLLQAKSPAASSQWAAGAVINLTVPTAGDF